MVVSRVRFAEADNKRLFIRVCICTSSTLLGRLLNLERKLLHQISANLNTYVGKDYLLQLNI